MVITASLILQPSYTDLHSLSKIPPLLHSGKWPTRRRRSVVPMARLFGPAIFEASKLKVLHIRGVEAEGNSHHHQPSLPRAYTLTHSDITSKLTLAISNTINRAQLKSWSNRLNRDEVVAEWKKIKGSMSLHVHCHISGGHFLLDLLANLRYYVFCKELPVVLKAFVYGDKDLFGSYPELEEAPVWVYFHSNIPKFSRLECWGPLREATSDRTNREEYGPSPSSSSFSDDVKADDPSSDWPKRCQTECDCCFPPNSLIPWPDQGFQSNLPDAQYQQH